MERVNAARALIVPAIASLLLTALVGASVLNLVLPDVAEAQTEPNTAANGVVLPPQDYDPAANRNVDRADSAVVPATPASGKWILDDDESWRLRRRGFQCWRLLRGRSPQQTIAKELGRTAPL
jgi:hypothetical protein